MPDNSTPTNKQRIAQAAFRLFSEQGYALTSYTAVAEQSGAGRPLVQRYYPKKEEFAVEFIREMMVGIDETLKDSGIPDKDPLEHTMHFGQLYYAILLSTPGMRTFLRDILGNRSITIEINKLNNEFTVPSLTGRVSNDDLQAGIKATGGVYELAFWQLEHDIIPDPKSLSAQNISAFLALSQSASYQEKYDYLLSRAMTVDTENHLVAKTMRALLNHESA